jgi:hypothetical protein
VHDESHVQEALAQVSTTILRALMRIEENARRAGRAEAPPKVKAADILPESAAPSDHPSTADAPLTYGAARRA